MSDHEQGLLEWLVGNAKRAFLMRLAILAAIIVVPIVVWFYLDKHNDSRYVGQIQYVNDLKNQEEKTARIALDLAAKTQDLARSLDTKNQILTQDHEGIIEIRTDIKWLKDQKVREITH